MEGQDHTTELGYDNKPLNNTIPEELSIFDFFTLSILTHVHVDGHTLQSLQPDPGSKIANVRI